MAYFVVLVVLVIFFDTNWLFLCRGELHAVVVVCRRRHFPRSVQLLVRYCKAKEEVSQGKRGGGEETRGRGMVEVNVSKKATARVY